MATFRFNTREFVSSHMRQPKGRGSWAFVAEVNGDLSDVIFSPSMTLTDAKKWVQSKLAKDVFSLKADDVVFVDVLP